MRATRSATASALGHQPSQRRRTMAAFWPPKPKALTSATSQVALPRPQRRQVERAGVLVGVDEVERGRHDAVLERLDRGHRGDGAGRAEGVADGRLGGRDADLAGVLADERVDGDQLGRVALGRARGVGADEVDALGAQAGLLERAAGGAHGAARRPATAS